MGWCRSGDGLVVGSPKAARANERGGVARGGDAVKGRVVAWAGPMAVVGLGGARGQAYGHGIEGNPVIFKKPISKANPKSPNTVPDAPHNRSLSS